MSESGKIRAVPTLLENCLRFYNALDAEAITTEDGTRVFKGHTTVVMGNLNPPIGQSHYTRIRRYLVAMDCIEKVQAGSRFSESVWILRNPPTQELLANADPAMLTQNKGENAKIAVLTQSIKDIQTTLGGLDIAKAMQNHEERITELEKQKHNKEKDG